MSGPNTATFWKVLTLFLICLVTIAVIGRESGPEQLDKKSEGLNAKPKEELPRRAKKAGTRFPDSKVLGRATKGLDWQAESNEDGPTRDVVLIVLDTVRQDRIGAYGYDKNTTPHLDDWAAGARRYANARSVSSWTLPSHASLFTGQYPMTHGVHTAKPGSNTYFYALPEGRQTLASQLRDAGYATAGIVANRAFLNRRWGLHQGFDVWLCDELATEDGIAYVPAERITDLALEILEKPREKPLFLFLNYMDAHGPLIPRPGFVRDGITISREQMPTSPRGIRYGRELMQEQKLPPTKVLEAWSEGYDAELRYLDVHLARLLNALEQAGVDDEDYVVILSDHGEFLGEHFLLGHNKDLYEEGIAIPLLVRGPDFAPGVDESLVQTLDVPRWILDGVGVDRLEQMEFTGALQVAELYWSLPKNLKAPLMRERFDRVRRAYISGTKKLLLGSDASEERFDLLTDPGEQHPLRDSIWQGQLNAEATGWLEKREARTGSEVSTSDGEEAALRALGYIE